ncbi:MAG: glucose-6-phosphate dehydrogenase [Planctomycetota bacterium]
MLTNDAPAPATSRSADAAPLSSLVIFGGTGDLARRKLLPALARLSLRGAINARTRIVGVATSPENTEESYRELVRASLVAAEVEPDAAAALCSTCIHYQGLGDRGEGAFRALGARLEELEREHDLPPRRAFYLALPTGALGPAIQGLRAAGLHEDPDGGWTRVVVEKPFGNDLASAEELVELLRGSFREEQIFRIDHYLGKETVQNLLAFRFGNPVIEGLWNRDRIAAVEISVSEQLGVGTRAGYYDRSGALRDMVQNHLVQLLTLVAMEVPPVIDATSVRYEKAKVLRSMGALAGSDVVYGQYAPGEIDGERVSGYLDEDGVGAGSATETFAALRCSIQSWRWQGVPFYLRTGKRMGRRLTRIGVQFKESPVCMFESDGVCKVSRNVLTLTLQPDEGFSLYIDVKQPGSTTELERIPLSFRHGEHFGPLPDAYETLLLDVLRGDQTLFVHSDEVLASWRVFDPLLGRKREVHPYPAGSWGPDAAARFAIADRALMRDH